MMISHFKKKCLICGKESYSPAIGELSQKSNYKIVTVTYCVTNSKCRRKAPDFLEYLVKKEK